MSQLDFLIGTWKLETKDQFEVWDKNEKNELIGQSFSIKNNQKVISETLIVKEVNKQVIYEATVLDQNEGRPVQFILNKDDSSCFSFENDRHDFPKKIQYKKITNTRVEVSVLGDKNEGFSFIQIKQKSK